MRTIRTRTALTKRPAFTLVEVLVIVGIVAVLIALLLASVVRARAISRRATCQSNLHQISLVYFAYAAANGGYFPRYAVGGTDLYWISNLDELKLYGLSRRICDCPSTEVWPRTDGIYASWDQPLQDAPGVALAPTGYSILVGRPDGYHGISGSSFYRSIRDHCIMGDGQTPTPLFACYAVHEQDPTGQWNDPPGKLGEPTPMHGRTGINAAQIDGSVIFKPFSGREIYGYQGPPDTVKFYLFPSDAGGNDALAY